MNTGMPEWNKTLCEAVGRLQIRYDQIGRKTGAPFLAIVYPLELEKQVLKEWDTLVKSLGEDFQVMTLDVFEITHTITSQIGLDTVLESMKDPEPGCDPERELGNLWLSGLQEQIESAFRSRIGKKPVIVLKHLAALYPAAGPQILMQRLWDSSQNALEGPVVLLIPGTLIEPRRYSFLNVRDEFMYRGEIL